MIRTCPRLGWSVAVVLVTAAVAGAQVPAVPVAPAVPPPPPIAGAPTLPSGGVGGPATGIGGVGTGAGAGVGAAPAAAAPRNIWSFFLCTPEQKLQMAACFAKCKARFCASPFGQMANGFLLQATPLSAGLIRPICPIPSVAGGTAGPNGVGVGTPNPAHLALPVTTPEGAAARIMAEENPAVLKARIAALQFLGTVDCRYYPEAEAALILGLRAEKNECVRLAAAKALANGCCCSPKIVKALLIVVNCSNKDKFPAEPSELVRAYAYVALERCLRRCVEAEPEVPPEPPPAAKQALYDTLTPLESTANANTHILLASYYAPSVREIPETLFAEARAALAKGLKLSPETLMRLNGPRNVADALLPSGAPRLTPADVITRLDAVVDNAARGPRERSGFLSTMPKREAKPQPQPLPQPVVQQPAQPPREFVMTVSNVIETGKPVPVTMATEPPANPTEQPRAKKSVSSLWKEANRR